MANVLKHSGMLH